ncbi:MAG: PIN domain-containing protein [Phycisphaerales bacterium]|nr:PIN domain-containing protein [Phycisphaerales bacterium]
MTDLLIDTSLFIDSLRASPASTLFFAEVRRTYRPVVHPVVEAELLAGARNRRELRMVERLLNRFESLPLESVDARSSLRLLRRHRLSHGMSWEDCLLAATALRLKVALGTLNDRHFRAFRGLRVVRPY